MAKKGRTYHPNRTFDDQLAALAELYKKQAWTYASVAELEQHAVEQRKEREQFDALTFEYLERKVAFAQRQLKRHEAFQAALAAARGANRYQPATIKMLEPFKRPATRGSRKAVVG